MSLFSAIGQFARKYTAARARYLTQRQIDALPFDIQKDIGWPTVDKRSAAVSR